MALRAPKPKRSNGIIRRNHGATANRILQLVFHVPYSMYYCVDISICPTLGLGKHFLDHSKRVSTVGTSLIYCTVHAPILYAEDQNVPKEGVLLD